MGPTGIQSEESDNPTAVVTKLAAQFSGEIPELTITRPSLEDIYLKMIGGHHE
jgi:ABC-2 type transport system ATP-binding protein